MADTAVQNAAVPGKARTIALWVLQILAAVAFLGSASLKLSSAPQAVEIFAKIGYGQWFRYLTGTLEALGAIGLFIPRFSFYAALLLAVVMIGAIVSHLTILGGSPVAAAVLLVIAGTIAYLRKP